MKKLLTAILLCLLEAMPLRAEPPCLDVNVDGIVNFLDMALLWLEPNDVNIPDIAYWWGWDCIPYCVEGDWCSVCDANRTAANCKVFFSGVMHRLTQYELPINDQTFILHQTDNPCLWEAVVEIEGNDELCYFVYHWKEPIQSGVGVQIIFCETGGATATVFSSTGGPCQSCYSNKSMWYNGEAIVGFCSNIK